MHILHSRSFRQICGYTEPTLNRAKEEFHMLDENWIFHSESVRNCSLVYRLLGEHLGVSADFSTPRQTKSGKRQS